MCVNVVGWGCRMVGETEYVSALKHALISLKRDAKQLPFHFSTTTRYISYPAACTVTNVLGKTLRQIIFFSISENRYLF